MQIGPGANEFETASSTGWSLLGSWRWPRRLSSVPLSGGLGGVLGLAAGGGVLHGAGVEAEHLAQLGVVGG